MTTPSTSQQDAIKGWAPKALCCWCNTPLVRTVFPGFSTDSQVWICPSQPCHLRQLKWAIVRQVTEKGITKQSAVYLPLPKQTVLLEAVDSRKYKRILFGGAAGGSKSHSLRFLAYHLGLTLEHMNILLLRRTWPELESTHILASAREAPLIGAKAIPSKRVVEFPSTGSVLRFGHCNDEKDMTDYLSTEYDVILFDELVTFSENQYLLISSRARTSRPDWIPMVIGATNPGGPGAAWIAELFIDKTRDPVKYPAYNPSDYLFIPSYLDDNPYINPEYVQFLMDLPPEMREAYRWGRWDIFPGQYFQEFRRERHAKKSLIIPTDIPRIAGMDWGYLRPGVFLWAVVLPDGRLYIEREHVFRQTIASEVAKNITDITKAQGLHLMYSVGDPAMWIKDGQTGESIAETLQKNGLYVQRADHERVNGWNRVRAWLRDAPDGIPWLLIDPTNCPYLVRTLPQLVQDDHKLEDVDTKSEDHAADALRYLLMSRPAPLSSGTDKLYTPGSAGELMQSVIDDLSKGSVVGSHNVR